MLFLLFLIKMRWFLKNDLSNSENNLLLKCLKKMNQLFETAIRNMEEKGMMDFYRNVFNLSWVNDPKPTHIFLDTNNKFKK